MKITSVSLYDTFAAIDSVELFKYGMLTGAICFTMSRIRFDISILPGLVLSTLVIYVMAMRTNSTNNNRHSDLTSKIILLQQTTSLPLDYVYLEPEVVDFFAEESDLRSFAANSYDKSLAVCDSILALKYSVEQGLPRCSADIDTAFDLRVTCLNAFSEITYNLPSQKNILDKHSAAMDKLHGILLRILNEMKQDCRSEQQETVLEDQTSAPFASRLPYQNDTLATHYLY